MIWLANNWRLVLVSALLIICYVMAKLASHYHGQFETQSKRADAAELVATQRQQTIDDMQTRQRDVAALDAKYTGELADAKAVIDQLQSDVAAGRKRLQLKATCTKQSTTGTASMDDAASPRLTDAAERDYFTLRERIEISSKMITALQQYIKTQCENK